MASVADAGRIAEEIAARIAGLASSSTPAIRSVRREYSRMLAKAAPDVVMEIAFRLVSRCRFVAYELVKYRKAVFKGITPDRLLKLADEIDSWGAVDCFGCILAGPGR